MQLGIGSYAYAWSIGVPGHPPAQPMTAFDLLDEAARLGVRSESIPIDAIYAPQARPSHFRAVLDVLRITRMVAWKLLSRAMYPQGFARAFLWRRGETACVTHPEEPIHRG